MLKLDTVTLIGIDCVDVARLELAAEISCRDISFGAVKLLSSQPSTHKDAVLIDPLTTIDAYSQFCLRELHRYVETPYALIIQHDGFVLNAAAWDDAFFAYDYLGAPILVGAWAYGRGMVPEHEVGTLVVGNGGFSLRSHELLKLTAELIEVGSFNPDGPEDWVQCYTNRALLEERGMKFAPAAVAERFSFEGRSKEYFKWQDSFGFHSLKWTDISRWLAANPAYAAQIPNHVDLEQLD